MQLKVNEGLRCMKRLLVQFSYGLPIISGMRQDVNVLIFLDVNKALEEGMKLYISDNEVIYTNSGLRRQESQGPFLALLLF